MPGSVFVIGSVKVGPAPVRLCDTEAVVSMVYGARKKPADRWGADALVLHLVNIRMVGEGGLTLEGLQHRTTRGLVRK